MIKFFIIALSLILSSYSFAQVADCKVERTDGVTLFGQCFKEKEIYIFKSCIEFTCQVNPSLTRKIEPGDSGCALEKITPEKFKASVLAEHQVTNLKDVKHCLYGK